MIFQIEDDDDDDDDDDEDDEEMDEASTSKKKTEREIELELGDDYVLGENQSLPCLLTLALTWAVAAAAANCWGSFCGNPKK